MQGVFPWSTTSLFAMPFREYLVGVEMHLLGKIFVKNEPKNIVAEFVSIHFAAQRVGYIPKLRFQFLFLLFCHVETLPHRVGFVIVSSLNPSLHYQWLTTAMMERFVGLTDEMWELLKSLYLGMMFSEVQDIAAPVTQ
jgi:hypothetical protein